MPHQIYFNSWSSQPCSALLYVTQIKQQLGPQIRCVCCIERESSPDSDRKAPQDEDKVLFSIVLLTNHSSYTSEKETLISPIFLTHSGDTVLPARFMVYELYLLH